MYSYEWDNETGGYLLTTSVNTVVKEVRPVFKEELRLLGFDQEFGWQIPETDDPIMWAEGRRYIYRGEPIGQVKGGGLYEKAKLVSNYFNLELQPVNIPLMVYKNQEIMNGFVQKTLKFIYSTYQKYQSKVDLIYVAFSGGKDSVVLLDLAQRALPHDKFKVVFADTTMELDDTYQAVQLAKDRWKDIDFHTTKSHLEAPESWDIFGYPARKLRWCCSIHKTVPQVLLIKELVNKDKFRTLVYVGVRSEESEARSQYNSISDSTKHIMQTGCYPIIDWNTTELFLYIFSNDLLLNKSYKKGLTRAGCIFCPMSSNWSFMINGLTNKGKTDIYVDVIQNQNIKKNKSSKDFEQYFNDVQWKHRLSGRDINIGSSKFLETVENGYTEFLLKTPTSNWRTWMSTIGTIYHETEDTYTLEFQSKLFNFYVSEKDDSTIIRIRNMEKTQETIRLLHLIRNVCYKASYCIGCKLCEAECPIGAIKFVNGNVTIENCVHCGHCLDMVKGCILAKSLAIPVGGKLMKKKSVAAYYTRGFRPDWLELFFELGSGFWINEQMGKNMILSFKVWGRDAGIIDGLSKTPIGERLQTIGTSNILLWSTVLTNLAYDSQLFNWYIKTMPIYQSLDNDSIKQFMGEQYSLSVKNSALLSLKETLKTSPIGNELGVGICEMKGNQVLSVTRTTWQNPEPLAILYSLYKFAEASDHYYSFTLTDLMDDSPERPGISPAQIFGLSRETLQQLMYQLSLNYGEFISVVFNKDLESIYLNNEKTSLDVTELF
jgi:phosphoadenosine phosphosulfate reductase